MKPCLWAPWRMAFIQGPKSAGCVFCALIAPGAAGTDRERLILWRGSSCFCLLNLYPYNPGHLMVVPYAHTGSLKALPREAQHEMTWLLSESIAILEDVLHAEGMNCGMNLGITAGAGVPDHLHMHAVPRWTGDTNFMPVVADVKAIPEYVDVTYGQLIPAFEQLTS